MAAQKNLSTIVFDRHVVDIRVAQQLGTGSGGEIETGPGVAAAVEIPTEAIAEPIFETVLAEFPERVPALMQQGDPKAVRMLVNRIFDGLQERDLHLRERVLETSRSILENLAPTFQHDFACSLTDPMLREFAVERDANLLVLFAAFLHRLVIDLINFGAYPPAARILRQLRQKLEQMPADGVRDGKRLAKRMEIQLSPVTERLLVADLKSGEASRQRNAAQLLESLGSTAVPLLIEAIKNEPDYRTRQAAASLLSKNGPSGAKALKRLLVLEIAPQERARSLEVIDTVTTDVVTETMFALGDEDDGVRMAAFGLTQRLKDARLVEMLLENVRSTGTELALAAVRTLEKLKPPNAVDTLADILQSTRDDKLRIACCRALGQIAKTECIAPLTRTLRRKSLFRRRPLFATQVRATAAFALGQIHQAQAIKSLAGFVDDPDARVREVARRVVHHKRPSRPAHPTTTEPIASLRSDVL
jgi:hypothetical protein